MNKAPNFSTWDRLFSAANFDSYIHAAYRLYERLYELEADGFTTLVYPSRGTTPFKDLVAYSHLLHPVKRTAKFNLQHALELPFWRATIELPFTADDPAGDSQASASIRDYWVQVLRAILHGELTNDALRYYQYTLDQLFGFSRTHGAPLHKPSAKFVFVDTVVSGRAVCEIVAALGRHGLDNFHLVLLIDENGAKLRSPYRETIDALERDGRVTRIFLASIFTEDRGPAITSTWCLTAPQLAAKVPALLGASTPGPAGTAVSFLRLQHGKELGNLSTTMLGGALFGTFQPYLRALMEEKPPAFAERMRLQLVDFAVAATKSGNDPLSPAQTKRIAQASIALDRRPIGLEVIGVEASNSHVLRLMFREKDMDDFLRGFANEPTEAFWFRHQ